MPIPKRKDVPEKLRCLACGKEFILSKCQRWYYRRNPSCRLYCCKRCYNENKAGRLNPKWRGGKTTCDGYIYVYRPNHPYATKDGYVAEHRLVIEKIIGRYLAPEEVVHHTNGDPTDNRPENLMLLPNEAEHRKLHAQYRTRNPRGQFDGHVIANAYL